MNPGPAGRAAAIHYAWRGWILGALLAAIAVARWFSDAPLQPGWLGMAAAGLWLRWQAGLRIQEHSNGKGWAGPAVAVHGPYRFGRHPLYLSNMAVIAGLLLYAHCLPVWAASFAIGLAGVHHALLALHEERFLAATPGEAGEAYRRYMRVTPRWLGFPGPRPDSAAGDDLPVPGGWRRQGANLLKPCGCAILIWLLSAGSK